MLATLVSQKDGKFYFVSYKAADLLPKVHFSSRYYFEGEEIPASEVQVHDEIAKFIHSIEKREVSFQRLLNRRKIKEIVNFYENAAAQPLIPGTILLFTQEQLQFKKLGQFASVGDLSEPTSKYLVIDGQHRLAGLHFYADHHPQEMDLIDVPCVIFDGKSADFAAEMFVIINSTHTRINKSHLVDLLDRVTSASPEKKLCARLVTMLYENGTSPLQYRINRLGGRSKQEKWVLQSELYNEFHRLVEQNFDFWEFSFNLKAEKAYPFVCDYFKAVAAVMENIWGKKTYMFHRAVTLKAVCRVLGDIIEKNDIFEEWEERSQKAFLDRVKNWSALTKEFRSEGFYERFAAKGQIERTRKIHEFLSRNLATPS
ncbi:MAG TPA: DGQHR domain-containing protein [Acidobacteriota bacterium]|nr:DGQHR domain-containing protein [Acidobacteriota bacterium]